MEALLLLRLGERFCREVVPFVLRLDKEGKGRKVVAAVAGRPEAEDEQLDLDKRCDKLFERLLKKSDLKVHVFSEHGEYGVPLEEAEYFCSIDPFDGSGLYRRGVRWDWWSVLSFFDLKGNPLVGCAVDILSGKMYLAYDQKATMIYLAQNKEDEYVESLCPSRQTSLGDDSHIAVYLMDPSYMGSWIDRGGKLLARMRRRFKRARLYANGGSCIYPLLAGGIVQGYVMFREPRSEIDPGMGFAKTAGLALFSVQPDGRMVPYTRYQPSKRTGRVPFFVAACNEAFATNLVQIITGERSKLA